MDFFSTTDDTKIKSWEIQKVNNIKWDYFRDFIFMTLIVFRLNHIN